MSSKDLKLIRLSEAKASNLVHYFTEKPCKRGHVSLRFTSSATCVECGSMQKASRSEETLQKVKAQKAGYYFEHAEEYAARAKKNRLKDLEGRAEKDKANYQRNSEWYRQWRAKYYQENKPYFIAKATAKVEHIKKATPRWADFEAIKTVYELAALLSKSTGVPHEVDHEVPLKGKNVSGLHVQNNLRAIPAEVNQAKKNKFDSETYVHKFE